MVSQESNCLLDKLPYITYLLDSENKDIVWSLFDQYKIKQKIQTAEDLNNFLLETPKTTDEINLYENTIKSLLSIEETLKYKMTLLNVNLPDNKDKSLLKDLNKENITVYLSIFVTILLTLFIIVLLFVNIPQNNKDLVTQLMLTLVGGWGGMMAYYFSSTATSKEKDARLERMQKNILDKK